MAVKFTDTHGSAKKTGLPFMTLVNGPNRFRMVGDILPRYIYWINTPAKNVPMECLAFDRDLEKFTNQETDWVPIFAKDAKTGEGIKCAWSYCVQVIDRADSTLKLLTLKKKYFEQILSVAKTMGDPTDSETGYDIIVTRKKTGTQAYNVEYEVQQIEIYEAKKEDKPKGDAEVISNLKNIDTIVPRLTSDDQEKHLKKLFAVATPDATADKDALDELNPTVAALKASSASALDEFDDDDLPG